MTYKTHITFGIALAIGVNAIADFTEISSIILDTAEQYTSIQDNESLIQNTSIFLYIWAGLSALIPDLDHAKAVLGKEFGFRTLGKFIRFLVSNKHRGPSHTLEFALLYAAIISGITFLLTGQWFWFVFYMSFIGYFSHILIDMFNNRGVRLTLLNTRGYLSLIPGNMSPIFRIIYPLIYGFALYMILTEIGIPDLANYIDIEQDYVNISNVIVATIFSLVSYFYNGITTGSDQENKLVFPIITLAVIGLTVVIWQPLYERMIEYDNDLIKDYPIVWLISLSTILFVFMLVRKKLRHLKAVSIWLVISLTAWIWITVLGWDELWDYYTEKGQQGIEVIQDITDS